ncbi:hypothetical protein C2G38_2033375 [Gigaspora rosea]|uniref:Uncharacterized protein n=1 Tax=Gigaspora rosea TaxID=44941 RepID=A0A397VJR1_9GLOM|nr:hypothetical protein C2G38_2033375 [Gigaspora rosea]
MFFQENDPGGQTGYEEAELKINKKRKHGEDEQVAEASINDTNIQEGTPKHNKVADDQNSRSELTPKILEMMSSEVGKVNNTEKKMDPGQITSMDIDECGINQYMDLEIIVGIDGMEDQMKDPWEESKENGSEREK